MALSWIVTGEVCNYNNSTQTTQQRPCHIVTFLEHQLAPTIQDDLITIIMWFRLHNIVLSAHIEKMF